MIQFGYINLIEKNDQSSYIDMLSNFFTANEIINKTKIIFEINTSYSDSELIELNTVIVSNEFNSLGFTKKYMSNAPLYISSTNSQTWFRSTNPSNPIFPIGISIDDNPECKNSCKFDSSNDFVFGIWKLQNTKNRYLIGWDKEKISREFLLYLLHWIFVKNC